jgi:transcriptional regulator with XRE-family HTH domain
MHPIAERLVKLRVERGLSHRELSELLGIDRSAVTRIELEQREIKLDEASKWADVCGSRLAILQGGEDVAALPDDERQLIEAWRRMKDAPHRQRLAYKLVTCLPRLDDLVYAVIESATLTACGSSDFEEREASAADRRVG